MKLRVSSEPDHFAQSVKLIRVIGAAFEIAYDPWLFSPRLGKPAQEGRSSIPPKSHRYSNVVCVADQSFDGATR